MAVNQEIIALMQQIKFNLFKEQNPETGRFDVIFEVEGKKIYAHKTMLNLVSDTFDAMISERWNANKEIPIKIESYGFENFYQFLTFLYSGECQLTDSNIFSMVDIAEFYGVRIFKNYCENYLSKTEFTMENIFSFLEMSEKYSMIQLKESVQKFIAKNFHRFAGCESWMKLEKTVVEELIVALKDEVKPEYLFQAVYKWSEKRTLNKRATNTNIKINSTIKTGISDFLPNIRFERMDLHFLHEFVVPKGFIFPSLKTLSTILCNRHPKTKLKITNAHGQTLHGNVIPEKNFTEIIKSLNGSRSELYFGKCAWTVQNLQISTQILFRAGIEWYLCSETILPGNGRIYVKHRSQINIFDCLVAELSTESSHFHVTANSKIEMV